ncbi:MAG: monofunctional biosynthetic peptidoglycan transglycosylase [Bacteroidaceae bacterium]|nr:monofunctional biosynthetic peptidoglycan transglycosylase [Bacteroidaceae bacterium]
MKLFYKIIRNIVVLFFAITILWVVMLRFIPVLITPLMFIRCVEQVEEGRDIKLKHSWTSISKMPYYAASAVIAAEDQNFVKHHGFDFKAIEQAAKENMSGNRLRGASTISQQTAKNVFLWPGRSWVRKGLETYFTALIELMWPKERIAEVYLNSIEMGEGIYGISAAADAYWNCEPEDLTRMQCATIAAILPNPRKYSATNPGPYIKRRTNSIYKSMKFLERNGYALKGQGQR